MFPLARFQAENTVAQLLVIMQDNKLHSHRNREKHCTGGTIELGGFAGYIPALFLIAPAIIALILAQVALLRICSVRHDELPF